MARFKERKFGGVPYVAWLFMSNKKSAEFHAKSARSQGIPTRVTKVSGGYIVDGRWLKRDGYMLWRKK